MQYTLMHYQYNLSNLVSFKHHLSIKLGNANVEQKILDLKTIRHNYKAYSLYEIIIFTHQRDSYYQGVTCSKYAVWARTNEEISNIYTLVNSSKIRIDKSELTFFVTPFVNNLICDIYIQEFPATITL